MTKQLLTYLTALLLPAAACGSDAGVSSDSSPAAQAGAAAQSSAGKGAPPAADGGNKAVAADSEELVWSTDDFTVEVGQERYVCFAKTLDRDIVVNGYSSMPQPFVHHLVFARTRAPEPEGLSECDVAFRSSWDMIYASGAGANKLDLPSDAGHKIAKGTQLLAQLHLLNAGAASVHGALTIRMRLSDLENPRPVSSYVFGSAAVKLPANATSTVVGDCNVREPVELIAGLPHMHQLGSSMRFEVADSDGTMREVFKRSPFSFDDQHVDNLGSVKLPADAMTRVTCEFNNTTSQEVTYGESTKNEMCYFVGFAIDSAKGGACVASPPPRP